jgi:putative transposase
MKEERIGCKIALEVGEAAGRVLDSQSKMCNWLYNHLLEQANTLKAEFKSSNGRNKEAARQVYSKRGLRDLVPGYKMEHPFLQAVHSSPLKNTALRLSEAIREYQKSRRGERGGGHTVNWPQFRSWKRKWFSLLYDEPWKGYAVEGRDLRLSLGVDEEGQRLTVTLRLAEPLPYAAEQVRGLRIVKEVGHFYAVFTVSPKLPPLQIADRVIALDPNHKNLV